MRRFLGCCVFLCCWPAVAFAQQDDYHPENTSWNGISRFVQLLTDDGYSFSFEQQISWDTIDPNDIPLFFYPLRQDDASPSPASVASFLRKGGRVMIADDFGAASVTFGALGLARTDELPKDLEAYGDNPSLPFAEPVPGHSLGVGVDLLLTNHPAVFHSALTPAFVLGRPPSKADPDENLAEVVVEGGLDEGRIIAVSDPSIFINAMMSYKGNETFARNLFRHLAGPPPGRGKFKIYVGKFVEYGTGEEPPASTLPGAAALQEFLRSFNEWLGGLSLYAPRGSLARLMAALLALSGFMALLARLSQQLVRYDGHWLGMGENRPRALAPHKAVQGLAEDDALGAAFQIEVDEFVLRLEQPIWQRRPNDKRFEKNAQTVLAKIRGLPPRAKPHQLSAMYKEWLALLTEAKLLDEWQRRSRG